MDFDTERLAKVTTLHNGGHNPGEQMCAMEAVAFVAGEPWSDHPECASQVIGAFMRAWNDGLPDTERTELLLPLIPRLIGTKGSEALEQRRAAMAADWLIRVHAPAWLRLAKLDAQADALERLPEITDFAQCPSLMPTLEVVRTDAAAWAAAGDAARAAAWAAAGYAAWAAAGDAAWDALDSTKKQLQQTAVHLVIRMCEARDE